MGVAYLLYLAFNAVKTGSRIFDTNEKLKNDSGLRLFNIGLLTNILNPKMAVFYLSFFPQFIKPTYGSILGQSLQLGMIQIAISFTVNFLIVLSAAKMAGWFTRKPIWLRVQKWFMASVLTGLAIKMAFTKVR